MFESNHSLNSTYNWRQIRLKLSTEPKAKPQITPNLFTRFSISRLVHVTRTKLLKRPKVTVIQTKVQNNSSFQCHELLNAPLKTVLSAKFSLPSNFNLDFFRNQYEYRKKTSCPLLACYLPCGIVQFVVLQFAILLKQTFSFVFKTCA